MFWNVILKYKYNSWHFPVFRLSSLFCEYLNFFQPNRPYRSLACSWLCLLLNILDGSGLWEKYWLWKINSRCLWNHSITAFYLIWIQRNSRLSKREHVWWMDVIWWLCHFGECIHWVTTRWERVICCCFIPCEFLLAILRVSLDINSGAQKYIAFIRYCHLIHCNYRCSFKETIISMLEEKLPTFTILRQYVAFPV